MGLVPAEPHAPAGVRCGDCHDPHGRSCARAATRCARCATSPSASTHPSTTATPRAGRVPRASIATCARAYMGVDARRDHGFHVPRPDQSVAFGVPNACSQCHREAGRRWGGQRQVRSWLGRDARGLETFATTFDAAEKGVTSAASHLYSRRSLRTLRSRPLSAPLRRRRIRTLRGPMQRRSIAPSQAPTSSCGWRPRASVRPYRPNAATSWCRCSTILVAPSASRPRVCSPRPVPRCRPRHSAAWQRAAEEYVATLRYNADRPESNVALGGFHAALGEAAQAEGGVCRGLAPGPGLRARLRQCGRRAARGGTRRRGRGIARARAAARATGGLDPSRARTGARSHAADRGGAAIAATCHGSLLLRCRATPTSMPWPCTSTGRPAAAIELLEQAARRWPGDREIGLWRSPRTSPERDLGGRSEVFFLGGGGGGGGGGKKKKKKKKKVREGPYGGMPGPLVTLPLHEALLDARCCGLPSHRRLARPRPQAATVVAGSSARTAGARDRGRTRTSRPAGSGRSITGRARVCACPRYGRAVQLVPTDWGPPTFEIDGIKMLPTREDFALCGCEQKVDSIQPRGRGVLDTCGGLGYFAACCLALGAARVMSFEKSADVIWLRRLNPWSPRPGRNGELVHGDVTERVERWPMNVGRCHPARPAAVRHCWRTILAGVL